MKELTTVISPELRELRQVFNDYGFDLRLVGGCVRDLLNEGDAWKDVDLCTDASPDKQILIYAERGIDYYETGLQHGTLTVKLKDGQTYEITSLRVETDHDGRHATVHYTRDWIADLARRDLTINAMALTFDGELIDPFNGAYDLDKMRVRFCGVAHERIQEDYLRILRWFRFHARFGLPFQMDGEAVGAIRALAPGLKQISGERVWAETAKIVTGPMAGVMLSEMRGLGVSEAIGLPAGDAWSFHQVAGHTLSPVTRLVAYLGDRVRDLYEPWRWSRAEQQLAEFLLKAPDIADEVQARRLLAVDRASVEHVLEWTFLRRRKHIAKFVTDWQVPMFPISGDDLLGAGISRGPEIGKTIQAMKVVWERLGYTSNAEAIWHDWSRS